MSFDTRNMTQGGQVIKYMIGMFIQIMNIVSYWSIAIGGVAFVAYILIVSKWVYTKHAIMYFYVKNVLLPFSKVGVASGNFLQKTYDFDWVDAKGKVTHLSYTYEKLLSDPYFLKCAHILKMNMFWGLGIFILVFFGVLMVVLWYLGRAGEKQRKNEMVGGRFLAKDSSEVNRILKKLKKLSPFKIGDLHLVKDSEIQNIALHGTVGTGKSTAFNDFLSDGRKFNQRAIIYDKGCNFIPMFYREGKDIILNPLDARCPNWDLWQECKDKVDFENFASPLLPDQKSGDPFWVLSARNLFVATAEAMRKDPERSIRKLLNALLSIPLEDLRAYVQNTDASNLVDGSIEKTAITIRTVLGAYARSLRVCQGLDERGGEKFSISEWVKADNDAWIFISSDGRIHETIKPLITAWLDIAMRNVLALKPNLERRVWTILDELNSLHKLPMLLEYLSEARKFGAVSVIGLQSFAQLENNYGREAARAIWDLLNTAVYFRAPSGEVSEWVQKELGEIRHKKFKDQYSYGVDTIRDGVNFSKDEEREHIVSYSDIQNLNDLECYVSLLGDLPVVKVKLERKTYPMFAEGKIERDMLGVFDSDLDAKIKATSMLQDADKIAYKILGRQSSDRTSSNTSNSANNGGVEVGLDSKPILAEIANTGDLESLEEDMENYHYSDNPESDKYTEINTNTLKHRNDFSDLEM